MLTMLGEYVHIMDSKGRLIIPSKFREVLGEKFILTKGLDGCLFLYSEQEWDKFDEKLQTLPLTNSDARKFMRFFLAGASICELDKQGRVLIPPTLRDFACLEKEVVLVGVGKRGEIWNRSAWQETNQYKDMQDIAESMEGLGI
ncbi:transcriptional regulator MraZ [Clostridia bacterium]|nr:transcriptional regulator MraZ [Clostridia bacterium]